NGGPVFMAYGTQKCAVLNGRYLCPQIDPLIERRGGGRYTHIVIGHVQGPEATASIQLPHKINWLEFVFSLFFHERDELRDLRFVVHLYRSPKLCFPNKYPKLHALRTFFIARYFA